MKLIGYLESCRRSLDREGGRYLRYLEIDKARGTTPRMHDYCCKVGLGDIPDLDRVWRPFKKSYLWRVRPLED